MRCTGARRTGMADNAAAQGGAMHTAQQSRHNAVSIMACNQPLMYAT